MQLHNEAFSLPEALLDHLMEAKLVTKEGEALPPQLSASQFKQLVPKLDKEKLTFWMVLHQEAYDSFKRSGFDQLPQQRCSDTQNANLGNWQASSSFAKQAAFFGWIVNRHPKLADQESFMCSFTVEPESFSHSARFMKLGQTVTLDYRASDTQLVFWGKLDKKAFQPSLTALGVEVGAFAWKLPSFHDLAEEALQQRRASTGDQLPQLGSLLAIGSRTASSMQPSTRSLQRNWEKLRRLRSLSRST